MEDELNGITNGALLNRAADERNPHELRLRAGRKAIQEYVKAGDSKKLEQNVYCNPSLPREIRVEAGLELVRYAAEHGQDLRLIHLANSQLEEVRAAACRVLGRAPGENRWKPPLAKIPSAERAVARL
ncbi:MAG: hypothetical protein AB1657_02030 [Candidatus Micrarchaeota archaeon]